MFLAKILVGLLALALPVALYAAASSRGDLRPASLRSVVATFALGVLAFVPAWFVEGALSGLSGQTKASTGSIDLAALVYAFLVAAPIEEGLKVAAAAPVWKLRVGQHRPFDGIAYATVAGLGFATARSAFFLYAQPFSLVDPARAALAAISACLLASLWGYALGREPQYRLGGSFFNAAWVFAVVGNGVAQHLAFARGPTALFAMAPVIAAGGGAAWLGSRELLSRTSKKAKVSPRKTRLLPAAPSLRAISEALSRTERGISFLWIGIGTLVTTGVITAMLILAVVLGRRMGIDFAAVDRDASQAEAIPPLLLLGGAALAAFPVAGWIIARASSADSVIEPAVSSLFAIVGAIILLGLAAPVAVVIALACAPLAFGLACLGAWLGSS